MRQSVGHLLQEKSLLTHQLQVYTLNQNLQICAVGNQYNTANSFPKMSITYSQDIHLQQKTG